MLAAQSYEFTPAADQMFHEYLARRLARPRFAHGRSVRNALERARLRQANRIYQSARSGGQPTFEDLVRIEAQDILQSSVFSDVHEDDES
jgi:hypothetical protein